MIQLTRLNNKPLFVNADLIKFVEQSPDTLVTLISGEKLVVLETAEEICDRFVAFRRAILHGLTLSWDGAAPQVAPPEDNGGEEERSEPNRSQPGKSKRTR